MDSVSLCVFFYLLFKIYRVINIRIVLAGLEIWTNGDPYTRVKDAGDLDRFKKYRNEILTKKIAHDNAHLTPHTHTPRKGLTDNKIEII